MQKRISLFISCCLFSISLTANQVNDIITIKPMGNIYGSNGGIQKEDKFKIGIIYDIMTKSKAYNGSTQIQNDKQRKVKVESTKYKFKYGFKNYTELSMIIPYVKSESSDKTRNYKNEGLQDIQLMLRYGLMNPKKGDPFYLSIGVGIDLPTAKTDKKFYDKIIADKQLGTGSYDYIGHIGFTKLFQVSRIDASIKYQDNRLGDNNYEKGDVLSLNAGYNYAFTRLFDLQIEVDAKFLKKNKTNGVENDASGGDTIYLTPGFHYRIIKSLSFGAVVPIVVKRDMNYDKVKKVGGLSEDKRVVLKLEYTF